MKAPNKDGIEWGKLPDSENRPAFIAALIMERCRQPTPARLLKAGPSLRAESAFNPHQAQRIASGLVKLAERIKNYAVQDCNVGLTDRQESAMVRTQEQFRDLAELLGFEARTGGDPRGACAYLIDPDDRKGDGWGEGWAVYR